MPVAAIHTPAQRSSVPSMALVAARVADTKAAEDTAVLEMTEALGVVDAFVIASGRNRRQVRTVVEDVERELKQAGAAPQRVEGLLDATWVLMDYGDFVVHVFVSEARQYYDLEHLWAGAPRIDWRPAGTG